VKQFRSNANNIHDERARIEKEIEALLTERQRLITQARKAVFPVSDMEQQLRLLIGDRNVGHLAGYVSARMLLIITSTN
jgi:hypothetical protein